MEETNIIQALPRHATKRYPRRSLSGITHVMFHHSATPQDSQDATDFARWHVNGHGWPGIAYAYVIDPTGKVFKCTELNEMGYHCKGRNRVSIGVCLAGHFSQHRPTLEQLESAAKLAYLLGETLGRRLLVDWHDHHRDTDCPGKLFPRQKLVDMISDQFAPVTKPEPDNDPEEEPEPPYHDPEQDSEKPGCWDGIASLALLVGFLLIALLFTNGPIK